MSKNNKSSSSPNSFDNGNMGLNHKFPTLKDNTFDNGYKVTPNVFGNSQQGITGTLNGAPSSGNGPTFDAMGNTNGNWEASIGYRWKF